ncbi:MAG: helix-turn-helix domain-containing protein [Acidimicrobiia bacterium]
MSHSVTALSELDPIAVNPQGAARLVGMSATMIFAALKDGSLPSIKIGRARRILIRDLEAWLESHRAT